MPESMTIKNEIAIFSMLMLALLISTAPGIAFASSSPPTITIASNPGTYGQNDKITATASTPSDLVTLYINSNLVAGPRKLSANYTICTSGPCLVPGTYAITAIDNTTGATSEENLVINPTYPTLSVQYSTLEYGSTDIITAYPGFYNDTMSILVDGAQVVSGQGVTTYTICGNASMGQQCFPAGLYNVTVFDSSEGVGAKYNKSITITPVLPKLNIQYQSIQYGYRDNITASAPLSTDAISIVLNSTDIASGTGNVSYTICGSSSQQCISPSNYIVYAYDGTENVNSSKQNLTITPAIATLDISHLNITYGLLDTINAYAPNPNDSIDISIDGSQVASGSGHVSYTICSAVQSTPCLPVGVNNVSAYDSVEKLYAPNLTITVHRAAPKIELSAIQAVEGEPITINGSAPYYSDQISVLINGTRVSNNTGTVSYTMCPKPGASSCLPPGIYKASVDDISEGVNTTTYSIQILTPQQALNTTPSTLRSTISTTTALPKPKANATTTVAPQAKAQGSQDSVPLEIAAVAAVVVIAFVLVWLWRSRASM